MTVRVELTTQRVIVSRATLSLTLADYHRLSEFCTHSQDSQNTLASEMLPGILCRATRIVTASDITAVLGYEVLTDQEAA